MPTKLMMVFVGFDVLFAACGGLLLGFSLISEQTMRATPTTKTVAQNLLLDQCPLTAGVVNAIFIFVTFLLSLPALFLPHNRGWLRAQGWLVVSCAIFTLGLGLSVWVNTLQTRRNLSTVWAKQSTLVQSLLQQRDGTCLNSLVAAQKGGCIAPFSSFANKYLDEIFTAAFGIVGIDAIVVMCVAMVLKYRQEQERYRHIDEKNAAGGF